MNVSGRVEANVIHNNACGPGGGGAIVDNLKNTVTANLLEGNSGTEPSAHGGDFYFLATT